MSESIRMSGVMVKIDISTMERKMKWHQYRATFIYGKEEDEKKVESKISNKKKLHEISTDSKATFKKKNPLLLELPFTQRLPDNKIAGTVMNELDEFKAICSRIVFTWLEHGWCATHKITQNDHLRTGEFDVA